MGISKALGTIGAALSLARIVVFSVIAMAVALVAAVHGYNRQTNPRPARIVRGILAAHPVPAGSTTTAPSGTGPTPWLPIEVEILDDAPAGSVRAPASPGVNDASRR